MNEHNIKSVVESGLQYLGETDAQNPSITVHLVYVSDLPDAGLGGLFTPLFPRSLFIRESLLKFPFLGVKALLHELHHLVEFNRTGKASGDETGEASGFAEFVMKTERMFGPDNRSKFCGICGKPKDPILKERATNRVLVQRDGSPLRNAMQAFMGAGMPGMSGRFAYAPPLPWLNRLAPR